VAGPQPLGAGSTFNVTLTVSSKGPAGLLVVQVRALRLACVTGLQHHCRVWCARATCSSPPRVCAHALFACFRVAVSIAGLLQPGSPYEVRDFPTACPASLSFSSLLPLVPLLAVSSRPFEVLCREPPHTVLMCAPVVLPPLCVATSQVQVCSLPEGPSVFRQGTRTCCSRQCEVAPGTARFCAALQHAGMEIGIPPALPPRSSPYLSSHAPPPCCRWRCQPTRWQCR
jgi:hypothetical protein